MTTIMNYIELSYNSNIVSVQSIYVSIVIVYCTYSTDNQQLSHKENMNHIL